MVLTARASPISYGCRPHGNLRRPRLAMRQRARSQIEGTIGDETPEIVERDPRSRALSRLGPDYPGRCDPLVARRRHPGAGGRADTIPDWIDGPRQRLGKSAVNGL